MSEKDDGGPAFPLPCTAEGNAANVPAGMSLRDWFAGNALLATAGYRETADMNDIAVQAYAIADAMLTERSKREGGK